MKTIGIAAAVVLVVSIISYPLFAQSYTTMDTVYTPAGYREGPLQATIYIPSAGNGIGVILAHWGRGTRQDPHAWCEAFAANGYVAMTIDYHDFNGYPDVTSRYPKPVRAFKTATEFLRRNAERFTVRAGKIVAFGQSEGSIHWGMAITENHDDAFLGIDSLVADSVDAAVLLYGGYDNEHFLERTPDYNNALTNYFADYPNYRATKGNCIANFLNIHCPVLLFHGASDNIVQVEQAIELRDSMAAHHMIVELVSKNSWGHIFDIADAQGNFTTDGLVARDSVLAFLHRTLSPGPIMRLSRTSLDFGPLVKAASDTLTVTVSNTGERPLILQAIHNSSAMVSDWPIKVIAPPTPLAIPSDGSLPVSVSFTPVRQGVFNDTLVIRGDDSLHSIVRLPITASGVDSIRSARQGVLYVSCYPPAGGALLSLHASDGTAETLGAMGISGITGLSIRHSDGVIYGALASSTSSGVYQVSASNGRAGLIRRFPVGNIVALAFSAGDTLYGGSSTGTLYRLDILSGAVDSIGTTKGLAFTGLSFRPRTGELWGSVRLPLDNIYVISRKTGIATLVGATGFSSITAGIAFDSEGKLLAIIDNRFGTDYLASIDTVTAIGSTIGGPLVVNNIHGIAITGQELQTGVKDRPSAVVPLVSSLEQNWPNPFNPSTVIKYTVGGAGSLGLGARRTSLVVYDVLGRKVATLVDEVKSHGIYEVRFDASGLASGVYFYRLQAGDFIQTKSLLVLR